MKELHLSLQLDPKNYEEEGKLNRIKKERGYNYMDVIQVSPEKMHNYEERVGGGGDSLLTWQKYNVSYY